MMQSFAPTCALPAFGGSSGGRRGAGYCAECAGAVVVSGRTLGTITVGTMHTIAGAITDTGTTQRTSAVRGEGLALEAGMVSWLREALFLTA